MKLLIYSINLLFISFGWGDKVGYKSAKQVGTSCVRKNNYLIDYNNITRALLKFYSMVLNKKIEKPDNLHKVKRPNYIKRENTIKRYRIYYNRKKGNHNEVNYYKDVVLELIDKFRDLLNAMLVDEKGIYPKDEILDVSRELDEIISYYYKTIDCDNTTMSN